MSFNYNESHRAPRGELFQDPPSYLELIKLIASKKMKTKDRAYLSVLLMTGARTSEILSTKQSNYKFYYNDGSNKIIDMAETQNLKLVYDRFDFWKFIVSMKILKQKSERWKKISCIRSEVFQQPFDWFVDYFQTLPVDPERKVFDMSRGQCWWMIKRVLGTNYWNHFFRHAVASNDVSSGINVSLVQNKLGHKSLDSMDTYLHMRSQDVEDAMKKVYGDSLQKYPAKINGPLNPNQVMGAVAASNQIGERALPPYYKKEAILHVNNKKIFVPMNQNARTIRDNLRKKNPDLIKNAAEERQKFLDQNMPKKSGVNIKKEDNDILQVV